MNASGHPTWQPGKLYVLPGSMPAGTLANMMIVFCNSKGGVGKSTLAVHTAGWLLQQGYSVSLLDTDRQRSSSVWMREVNNRVTIATADSPDECLAKAQELASQHQFVIGDGPAGLDEISRTLLLLADLAVFPISPSILDLRSVSQATSILRYAQGINGGRPVGRLVLNKSRSRDTISRELKLAAPKLGVAVTNSSIRDLQAFRDAAQQGTLVTRLNRATEASKDINAFCNEMLKIYSDTLFAKQHKEVANG